MPICYADYPSDWSERRARVLARAGHICEFCKAPNRTTVYRGKGADAGRYMLECGRTYDAQTGEYLGMSRGSEYNLGRVSPIVLTVAHLDRTGPPGPDDGPLDCPDDRLAALCQKCHFALDKERHAAKRATTLAARKAQLPLF